MAKKIEKQEKFYTAEEVATAVLKKTEELLKASSLFKNNTAHEVETGEEPNNDEAEAPEYLANADIEDSGAHGVKKPKKGKLGTADVDGDGDVDGDDALALADKDGDGDLDGDDAIGSAEEASGEDLDEDGEIGEPADHKKTIDAASKKAPKTDEDKDTDEKIEDAIEEKPAKEKEGKKPAFIKSEKLNKDLDTGAGALMAKTAMAKDCGPKVDLKKPSLKKFMLARKMKKSGGPTADSRAAEKLSGAPAAPAAPPKIKEQPSPAAKVKAQPKMQMEKNKPIEKLMGIKPKAGK